MFTLPDSWVWDFWLAEDQDDLPPVLPPRLQGPTRPRPPAPPGGHRARRVHRPDPLGTGPRRARSRRPRRIRPDRDLDRIGDQRTRRHMVYVLHRHHPNTRRTTDPTGRSGHLRPTYYTGSRTTGTPLVRADPRWYETLGGAAPWPDEHWRDPFVFADPDGNGWHLFITARANTGPLDNRGVIGHAQSSDLLNWDVQPPLSRPRCRIRAVGGLPGRERRRQARADLQLPTRRILRGTARQR